MMFDGGLSLDQMQPRNPSATVAMCVCVDTEHDNTDMHNSRND